MIDLEEYIVVSESSELWYTPKELRDLATEAEETVAQNGWTDPRVCLLGTLDYDDLPSTRVSVVGTRKETDQERKAREKAEATVKKAHELGVTPYEYQILLRHKDKLEKLND